jgi:hypothetical protein
MSTQGIASANSLQELTETYGRGQYTLWQILGVWLAAGAPMWLLGWVVYPALFSLYHLHQPWGIVATIPADLISANSGKRFRSNWFPIILHSGQSVFLTFLILGLVLGLA